jgi:hypothetical protein
MSVFRIDSRLWENKNPNVKWLHKGLGLLSMSTTIGKL